MAKNKNKYHKKKYNKKQTANNLSADTASLSSEQKGKDVLDEAEFTPCEYTVESAALKKALAKRNKLSSENVFSWRLSFNIYLWVKYAGTIIGALLVYVVMGYFVGRHFGIGLPLMGPVFDLVLGLFLFAITVGWIVVLGSVLRVYKKWQKDPAKFFVSHQTHSIGTYQNYQVSKGPFGMGSRNILGKTTPWIVQVGYVDLQGVKHTAQCFLGNTVVLSQMQPGDELCICTIKGHFGKTINIALLPDFLGPEHDGWLSRMRQSIKARQEASKIGAVLLAKDKKDFSEKYPIEEYIPLAQLTAAERAKTVKANQMSESRIRKMSIVAGDYFALRRGLVIGIPLLVFLMAGGPEYIAKHLLMFSYNTIWESVCFVVLCIMALLFVYQARSSFLGTWYWLCPPKKPPKYAISTGRFVSCAGWGRAVGDNYYWLITYEDINGNIKPAYIHTDNYEAFSLSKPNLPLTIVTVKTLWPYSRDFAYISEYFQMVDEPWDISGNKLHNF